MKQHLYPALMAGLIAAQIVFSVLVYFSNLSLYQTLVALQHSGYLIVPNARVMPGLEKFFTAIFGGLFFALTTGAGLSLVTFLAVMVWHRYFRHYGLLILLLSITALFFAQNFDYNILLTLACLLIIITVIFAALYLLPETGKNPFPFFRIFAAHLVVIGLIVLVWTPVADKDMFIEIRDKLLLTNPAGKKINDFYYKYTLYPAETFKSLDQKLLKSCHIIDKEDLLLTRQIQKRLMAEDYLPVKQTFAADLTVKIENKTLFFFQEKQKIYTVSSDEFINDPESILELISAKIDDHAFLRKMTFLSLIAASPLLCYILLHSFFMLILFFIKSGPVRFAGACTACLLIFALPAASFYRQSSLEALEDKEIAAKLNSDELQDRVAALKRVSEQGRPIDLYFDPRELAQSQFTVERYWLAKTLGDSRSPASYRLILQLLDDPQPNVVCMAFYSLGRRTHLNENSEVIREIISRINTSSHWYVQWYAYKALKRLGWTQTKQDA
jgi:hypothetical protein